MKERIILYYLKVIATQIEYDYSDNNRVKPGFYSFNLN